MARVTAVINQKGGVGKTTTAHALATGLTHRTINTLAVDADPQGNLSAVMQADADSSGTYDLMRGHIPATDAIQHSPQGDVIASNILLASADMEFTRTGREHRLREGLESVASTYDNIIIDCPPSLGVLTVNALTAATDIVIPVCPDAFSLQGLQQLLMTVSTVRKYSNPALKIAGILITRMGGRATSTRQLVEVIREQADALKMPVYAGGIREGIAIKESQIMRASIFDSHARAGVTNDYNAFIDEYLNGGAR